MTDAPPPQATAPGAAPAAAPRRAALTKELSEFLVEFSIALHKHSMYPEGHPSLEPAVLAVTRRAAALLEQRRSLSLGVAREQLVIEGVATDPKHPVLGELAGRLHRHHLGAVTFYAGLETDEVYELLRTLAVEADRTRPLGLSPPDQVPKWRHARLHPLTYDRLEMVDERQDVPPDTGDDHLEEGGGRRIRGAQLWVGLARAALAGAIAEDETPPTQPAVIAKAIDDHPKAEGYDQVIVGYLLQIADELRAAGGASALELKRRTSRLIRELKPETLRRLVEMGGDEAQRRRFVLDATDGMAVDAVIELLKAAADTSRQQISHSLVRVLNKLAAHAEGGRPGARTIADTGLRDQVRRLLRGWQLEDPNPAAYGAALQRMSQARLGQAGLAEPGEPSEPTEAAEGIRIVQMSLELGAIGPIVWRAVDDLIERGALGALLDLLDGAGTEGDAGATAQSIRLRVATPQQMRRLLTAEAPDFALIDRLLAITGPAGADELLDALAVTQSRTQRRALLERLARFGGAIAPQVFDRLDDRRWYVVRNLLALMEEWTEYPPEFSAVPYAIHSDNRVRRQALKLQLRLPAEREQAIAAALADQDEMVVGWGLLAIEGKPSAAITPLLARHAMPGASADLRPLALKALGRSGNPQALEVLLQAADGGRTFFGRPKLPPKSRDLLAALRALADGWADEPRAAAILARAALVDDPDIRSAISAAESA